MVQTEMVLIELDDLNVINTSAVYFLSLAASSLLTQGVWSNNERALHP